MPRKRKKERGRYGDYCEIIDGRLYASVNISLGNGKYKRKRKRVESQTAARQWAENELAEGRTDKDIETFAELAAWYSKEFLVPPVYQEGRKLYGLRTYKWERTRAERLSREFGGYKLNAITIDVLWRYKRERLKTVSITAVNRDFAQMRTMFGKAVTRKWMRENPFNSREGLIEPSLEARGRAVIDAKTLKRLLARSRRSSQPLLHYLILVMAGTGARPSEAYPYQPSADVMIEPLTWGAVLDYDFKGIRLIAYKGKRRKERVVPTSERVEIGLRELYAKVSPAPSDLIFPFTTVKRSWRTLCASIGVDVPIRSLRAYFNSWLIERGFDEVSRMLLMGHEKITTNLRYATLTPEFAKRFRDL